MNTKEFLNYNLSGKSLETKADLSLRMVSPTGIEPVTISLKEMRLVYLRCLMNTVIYLET